ncbi:MAG TPA: PDZ domain-containing protein [Pseudonocardiaceae bacterium]
MTGTHGYLRFPTIHGNDIAFVCEDDLWLVPASGGMATRLTAGVAEVSSPRLGPDGESIAYVSAEDGSPEVYVLPVSGGAARRLTFQAARCAVVGWDPVTGEIIYASTAAQPTGFAHRLFAVHPKGGAPRLLPLGPANTLAYAPDDAVLLGRNTADPARWKRYRGGTVGEIWLDRGSGRYTRLPTPPGNLAAPCWVGERVFFLSDHDGVGNVYSVSPDGTDLRTHTHHRDYYARNLATDGERLVYHAGADIHLLDPAIGEPVRLDIRLRSNRAQRNRRFVPADEHLHDATPSPDGARVALTVRGKAFTMGNWDGPVRQHGARDGVRYRLLHWLPGGTRLVAVASDERPDERLVLLNADGATPDIEASGMGFGVVTELAVSPTAQQVVVATQRQRLYLVDLTGQPVTTLLDSSAHGRVEDLAFSADGRWLAYSYPDTPRTTAIRLAELATGIVRQVTTPVLRDHAPAFDPDGRYLYFIGRREFTAVRDQIQFGFGFPLGTRPYLITLRADEPTPFEREPRPLGAADEPKATPPTIDFAGIERRIVPFPVQEGRYRQVLGLHGKALLVSGPVVADDDEPTGRVEVFDFATGKIAKHVGEVDEVGLSADRTALLCRAGERLRVVAPDQAPDTDDDDDDTPSRASGWLDLDRIRVSVRPEAEWRQLFREAWRMQRENFWDHDMAGLDWDAVYRRYLPLADRVASRAELSDLIWELQGELGTSHAYELGGDHRQGPEYTQGFLGVDWTVDGDCWRIGRVLTGDPWRPEATSPGNRPGADLRPGDVIEAVNGQPVGRSGPPELLVDQADREVELLVRRTGEEPRRVRVRALADESAARYRDWVAANRDLVHRRSRGRAGYLHVPDMLDRGYAEFIRSWLTEYDREGLLIDVRYNSGGEVSWLLLERLARRRLGLELGRWSGALPYPPESPRGPMVALTNEHAGSDGDIFSHAFTRLGLGPLVGKRTWGGVVATWPRHHLVDGTVTTQPEFRYVFDDVGASLENRGVRPDVEIDPAPHEYADGADRQLDRAVAVLLERLPAAPDSSLEVVDV